MRTNLILAVTAVVLAIPTLFTMFGNRVDFTEYSDIPHLFDGFTPDRVQFIVLSAPKKKDANTPDAPKSEPGKDPEQEKQERQQLVLVKNDKGTWVLGNTELKGVPVQQHKVNTDVLDHMKGIRIDQKSVIQPMATLSPEEEKKWLAERELTEDTGVLIQCLDQNQTPVAELFVGKDLSGGKWSEDVVRGRLVRAKDAKVAVAYEVDYWRPSADKDEWIDKKIHQFDMAKVTKFTLRNEKGEVAFEKEGDAAGKWKATKAPADVGAVRDQELSNLLSRFQYLNAQRFLEPLAAVDARLGQFGLKPGLIEVSATVKEGDKPEDLKLYTLVIGEKQQDKNEYYARSNQSEFLLSIGDWDRSPYEKDPKDFFEPSAATAAQALPKGGDTSGAKPADAGEDGPAKEPKEQGGESGGATNEGGKNAGAKDEGAEAPKKEAPQGSGK